MKGYVLFIVLSSVFLYYVLHCILWRENSSWIPVIEMKRSSISPCLLRPAFESLIRFHGLYPFLCSSDFKIMATVLGSDKISLPYGIKKSVEYFRLALASLKSCALFPEPDNCLPLSNLADLEDIKLDISIHVAEDQGILKMQILPVPCKKCVVVGNGAVLKNKTLGKKIDSYDVIIRMNDGPVRGYEEDVGTRTTFRIFYPESVFTDPQDSDPNSTAILSVFKNHDLKWLWQLLSGIKPQVNNFWKKPALNLIYRAEKIRILDPTITRIAAYDLLHFPKSFPENEKPKHPTTGIIAITLAFYICHEVHLAGFKYNFTDQNGPLHYYGNATMSVMSKHEYHNISAEHIFLKNIIENNFVINLTED